jgi:hypothetical protein
MGIRLGFVIVLIAVFSPSPSAAAGPQGDRRNPLESISGLTCRFSVGMSAVWKGGKPDVKVETATTEVTISNVDIQDGTADVAGKGGRRLATTVLSDGSLYFMESTRGALEVTTVFATESSPGKLKAVRAHHEYLFLTVPPFVEDPVVSQSYGECEPTAK